MISDDDKNEILVEIFELTGQKVGPDDPLVAAALFYSERLRRVSREHQDAVRALGQKMGQDFAAAIDKSVATLASAASTERTAANQNFAQMIKQAQHASRGEVPAIKRDLEKFCDGLMRRMRSKASPASEIGMSLSSLLGAIIIAGAAGFMAGYFWFNQPSLEDAKRERIATTHSTSSEASKLEPATVKGSPRHDK